MHSFPFSGLPDFDQLAQTLLGLELIGIVSFTLFPLLHILDRSKYARLWLAPGALCAGACLILVGYRGLASLHPFPAWGPEWGGYALDYVHPLLFVSFAFFAASPVIRWRVALKRRDAGGASREHEEPPA